MTEKDQRPEQPGQEDKQDTRPEQAEESSAAGEDTSHSSAASRGDGSRTTPPPPGQPPPRPRRRYIGRAIGIATVLVVIWVAIGGFFLWQQVQELQQEASPQQNLDARLDSIGAKTDEALSRAQEARQQTRSTQEDNATLRQDLSNLQQQLSEDITARLGTLADNQQGLEESIQALRDALEGQDLPENLNTRLEQITADIDKALSRAQEARQQARSMQEDNAALHQDLSNLQQQLSEDITARLSALAEDQQRLETSVQESIQSLQAEIEGQEFAERLSTLADDQQNLEASIQALRNELGEASQHWRVSETRHLIRTASDRLQLERDVATAIAALEAADQRLNQLEAPSLTPVRRQLTDDLVELRQLATPDITRIALTLSRLSEEVASLPTPGRPQRTAQTDGAEGPEEAEGWRSFVRGIWESVKGLVVVRREATGTEAALSPPQERLFLLQNLRLKLETARLAVLRRDQQTYRASLSTAQAWIQRYFDTEAEATQGILSSLGGLQETELKPALPDLSKSLNALDQWAQEHRLRQAPGEGDAS